MKKTIVLMDGRESREIAVDEKAKAVNVPVMVNGKAGFGVRTYRPTGKTDKRGVEVWE